MLTLNIAVIRIDGIVTNSNRRTFEISYKKLYFNKFKELVYFNGSQFF